MNNLKKVTKEEFFAYVGPRDIVTSVTATYGSDFKTRSGTLVGKIVKVGDSPDYKPNNEYYLVTK